MMNDGSVMPGDIESDKHQRIIDAAVRVFARKGYYSSRVADIAQEAGVAIGTIYLYFKTKEEILVTLFREKMAVFVRALGKVLSQEPDPPAKLRCLIRHHFEILESNPELAEVIQVELRQGNKFFRGASAREVGSYFDLIASVLDEGVATGHFRKELPTKVATKVLFGAVDQMTTSWVLGRRTYRLAETAGAVADLFLKGIARE